MASLEGAGASEVSAAGPGASLGEGTRERLDGGRSPEEGRDARSGNANALSAVVWSDPAWKEALERSKAELKTPSAESLSLEIFRVIGDSAAKLSGADKIQIMEDLQGLHGPDAQKKRLDSLEPADQAILKDSLNKKELLDKYINLTLAFAAKAGTDYSQTHNPEAKVAANKALAEIPYLEQRDPVVLGFHLQLERAQPLTNDRLEAISLARTDSAIKSAMGANKDVAVDKMLMASLENKDVRDSEIERREQELKADGISAVSDAIGVGVAIGAKEFLTFAFKEAPLPGSLKLAATFGGAFLAGGFTKSQISGEDLAHSTAKIAGFTALSYGAALPYQRLYSMGWKGSAVGLTGFGVGAGYEAINITSQGGWSAPDAASKVLVSGVVGSALNLGFVPLSAGLGAKGFDAVKASAALMVSTRVGLTGFAQNEQAKEQVSNIEEARKTADEKLSELLSRARKEAEEELKKK